MTAALALCLSEGLRAGGGGLFWDREGTGLRAKGPASSVPCPPLSLAQREPGQILKFPLLQPVGLLIQLETSQIKSRQLQTSQGAACHHSPARELPPRLSLTASSLRHGTVLPAGLCCKVSPCGLHTPRLMLSRDLELAREAFLNHPGKIFQLHHPTPASSEYTSLSKSMPCPARRFIG